MEQNVGNTDFQKKANEALILSFLRSNGPISRIELARRIGLRQSTVTYIVERLITVGLIKELGVSGKRKIQGRRPIPISLDGDFGYVLGFDLGPDNCRICMSDITGAVLRRESRPLPKHSEKSPEPKITDMLTHFFEEIVSPIIHEKKMPVLALGLSLPGRIDIAEGSILSGEYRGAETEKLRVVLKNRIAIPVIIEADANCALLGRVWDTPFRKEPSLYLFFKKAFTEKCGSHYPYVRTAMISGGNIHRGAHFSEGRLQHLTIPAEGNRDGQDGSGFTDTLVRDLLPLLLNLDPKYFYIGGDIPPGAEDVAERVREALGICNACPGEIVCSVEVSENPLYDAAYGACANVLSRIYAVPQIGDVMPHQNISWDSLLQAH